MARQSIISTEEYEDIKDKSLGANYFLNHERFKFIRDYINVALEDIEQKIINNQILEAREEVTISERIKRVLITPKKLQVDELKGVYKWLKKFLGDMAYYADLRKQLDEEIEKKKVLVK